MLALSTWMVPADGSTLPFTATWWPAWSFSTSGLSTVRTWWSLSVTNTIFSPEARHFFVQASPLALALLAPHLASVTQPLTVEVLAALSLAADTIVRQNSSENTRTTYKVTLF